MIEVGRMATAADPLRWTKQWRKATNVIRTCHRLARLTLSRAILRRTGSYVQIKIHDETDGDCDTGAAADADAAPAEFSVAADNEGFRRLVKDKRQDCFRRLGGAAGIASALASDAEAGIRGDDRDVRRRREAFGGNTYPRRKPKGFWTHVWDALSDVFLLVLLVCAAVSLGFGIKEHGLRDGWYDGVSIFLAVFLVAAVVAVSNHGQARRFDTLATESDNIAVNVVRGGRRQEVSIFDVVVGDVVVLNIGDVVPADGVFLQGHPLQVDESSMTGEPHPVDVDAEKSPFLASGVKVIDGYGHMLVTAVGTDTAWGEMMGSITREKTEPMPLQERLTSSIGKVGIAVAVLVVDVLVFAFSMKRMVKEHALVRTLSACETMGSVTAICTDKTGTLTLNQMKVTEFWVGTDHRPKEVTGAVVSLLRQGAGLNTTGSVYKPDNASLPEISGSPTEKTLLTWAVADLGMDADALKRSCKVLHVEAFNSDKKRSGVMIRDNATGAVTAHWKGAAEMVLANCSAYVGSDGAARELDAGKRRKLEEIISEMAAASLRCIAFAYKHVDSEHSKIDDEGLTLLGFVGLKDPCQPEVRTAIVACTKAGVAVKMVTGDNLLTARAIAMECGIISNSDHDAIVIEGQEFRAMSPQEQWDIVDRSRVTARSLPMDKLVPVQRLKQRGHVVAVAGDGTNDAPALKEADVGLSKGIQGTEVAKESSDIVIMNDNFDTVVTATRWGRCVFNNIQKFIQFQLTVNVAALIINFVSAVTSGKMPLSTVQLLWVNLIMDTMGALALATDTPTKALAEGTSPNPPTGKRGPIRQAGRHRRDLAVASQTIKASVAGRRSLALVLLVVAVSVTGAAAVSNKSLNITNHCSYTVWPGILSGAGSTEVLDSTGFELAPGESRSVSVPSGWAGLLWARTLCSTDDTTGKFTCVTGDCGSGREDCAGGGPAPPVTLGGFTLDVSGGMDLYDVSLVDGFNLPMVVAPHAQGADPGGNCTSTGCVVDLNGACPAELRVTSGTSAVACKSACQAFGSAEYCCTGEYGNPNTCKPSAYSELFKKACPLAVSYAFDDGADSIFTCGGGGGGDTTYAITFCASTTSGKFSSSPNSQPPGTGSLQPHTDGTTAYTGGGSQVGGAATAPWRIVLVVGILGAVTAALGVLAKFLGLFKLCCNQPAAGAAG